jgi:hypothetical protein
MKELRGQLDRVKGVCAQISGLGEIEKKIEDDENCAIKVIENEKGKVLNVEIKKFVRKGGRNHERGKSRMVQKSC